MARPATAWERFVKWTRRNPRLAAMATTAAIAAGLGLTGILWQWNQARRESRRAEQARAETLQVLHQMEAIELRRAEEYIDAGRRTEALPYLALVVRQNPLDRLAVYRLLAQLTHRTFPRLVCPPLQHSNRVSFVQFSPDARLVVSFPKVGTARLWYAADGKPAGPELAHPEPLSAALFSPDSRRLLTVSGMAIYSWDVTTGVRIGEPLVHPNPVLEARFSADGRWLLVHTGRGGWLWDAATGRRVSGPLGSAGSFHTARMDRAARRVVLASDTGSVELWDPESGQRLAEPWNHGVEALSGLFTRDHRHVVTVVTRAEDRTIRAWYSPEPPLPAPAWLADLAEALAGRRFHPDGTLEPVLGPERWAVFERVRTVPAGDFHGDWAAWFLAVGNARTISPASGLTVAENAARLAAFDTLPALLAAAHLDPTNTAILARLAGHLQTTVTSESTAHRARLADWLSR